MAQLIDHNGKLAISWGWMTDYERPQEVRTLNVSRIPAERYKHILGVLVYWQDGVGVAYWEGRRYVFEVEDESEWTKISETRPIKKPRKGKNYDWVWSNGQWWREWK